jgi:hypothetical protein
MKEKDATSSLFGEPSGDALTAAPTRKSIRRSARKLSRRWTAGAGHRSPGRSIG